jgi:TP901 family phage tail tape measure protein
MANESSVLVRLRLLGGSQFERGAHRAAGGLGAMSKRGRGVSKVFGGVNKTLGVTAAVMRGAVVGLGAVGAVVGTKVARGTIEFDKGMRNVNSIAQLSEKRLDALTKRVLALAGPTAQAPGTLAEGLYDLVSSGFNASESIKILRASARAATAGLTDTATSTASVAAVLNAYRLPASAAKKVSDLLFRTVDRGVISFEELAQNLGDTLPMAASLGVGLEQVGASVATMTKQGIGAPETMTRIRAVMASLVKPGRALSKTLKEQGFESGAALIKAKGFQGALDLLAKTTGGSQAEMAKLFPNIRALSGALALTGRNSKVAGEDLAGMRDAGGATSKALSQQSKSISFQWNRLKATASAVGISFGRRLVPAASRVLDVMNDIARGRGKVAGALKSFASGLRGGPPKARGASTPRGLRQAQTTGGEPTKQLSGIQKAGLAVRGVFQGVIGWAQANLPKLGSALMDAGRQLFDAFKPAAPLFQNVIIPLLKGVAVGIIGGVVGAFKVLVPIIRVVATVLGWLGQKLAFMKPVFFGIGVVIGWIAGGPILKALGALKYLGVAFKVASVPVRILGGIFGWLFRKIAPAIGLFLRIHLGVLRFVATFASAPARVARAVLNIVGSIIGKLASLHGKMLKFGGQFILNLIKGVREKLSSLTGFMGRVGRSIIDAVTNALKAAPGAIANAILNIVPGPLKGAAKKALGIVGLAGGGKVRQGGWAVVGEKGPELARFPAGSTVYDAGQTRRAQEEMGSGGDIYLTANLHLSGEQVHSEVFKVNRRLAEAR